jgi:hypothetical protein
MSTNTLKPKVRPIYVEVNGEKFPISQRVSRVKLHLRGFGRGRPHVVREHTRMPPYMVKRKHQGDREYDQANFYAWHDTRPRTRPRMVLADGQYGEDDRPNDYGGPVVITVIEENYAYGGPEEGGWYYDEGTPVKTKFLPAGTPESVIEQEAYDLSKHYTNKGRPPYTNTNSQGRSRIIISDVPVEAHPRRRPRYS